MKPAKEPFLAGIEARARETIGLGRVLATEPRAFPGALWKTVKRSLRTLWRARGGGLYATGFVLAFVFFECKSFVGDVLNSSSVAAFFGQEIMEVLVHFTVESLLNTLYAFLWPVYLIQWSPLWGAIVLGALYVVFPRFLKEPLEHWLCHDEDEAAPT